MEVGGQGHSGHDINAGGSAADQRGHQSAFDAPRYGENIFPLRSWRCFWGRRRSALVMIGFGNGGRRFSVLDSVSGIVLAVALWMTIDLDYPGIGLIRVSNLPVVETLAAMN